MGGSSSNNMSPAVIVKATARQTASVIFLHGLGDTGDGWAFAFEGIKKPHVKYIFPNAPTKPVTLNGGMAMPSWFDIYGLNPNSNEDVDGIKAAAKDLQNLISEEEKSGISRDRIIIGGFSQGGAVALHSAMAINQSPLAGILALSTWLPLAKSFKQDLVANQNTPILQCHGQADPVVQMSFGGMTSQLIKTVNPNHEFKTYASMGHSSSEEEMQDVKKFVDKILPPV